VLVTSGLMEVGCLCGITNRGDEMECARQGYICRAFCFTGLKLSTEVFDRV
jgi:hypothetical protein